MGSEEFFFEQVRSAGCLSYVLGCSKEKVCVVIDPEIDKADDYAAFAEFLDSKIVYAIDTHTHADHNSACKVMRERYGVKVIEPPTRPTSTFASTTGIKSNSDSNLLESFTPQDISMTPCACFSKIGFSSAIRC